MIVERLIKTKKNIYTIYVEGKAYFLEEDIILKYHLVKGEDVSKEILDKALEENDFSVYYHQAVQYALEYNKSERDVLQYLLKKGAKEDKAFEIIEKLKENKILNDSKLASRMIEYYIRKYNGRLLIEHKLLEQGFSKVDIELAIENMDMEYYYECLNALYNKVKDKYKNDLRKKDKIKRYLLGRGYTYNDIERIDMME